MFAVNAMLNLSYVCIIYEKTKANFPENITWSELGKQSIQP